MLFRSRCEIVAVINGVTYINDSKATNVDAVAKALRAIPAPVILIAGGRDKGLDYAALRDELPRRVKLAVLIGETRAAMARAWQNAVPCVTADSLDEAVAIAARQAGRGDTVLLSPACASFDMFRNYEHRGEEFKRAVFVAQSQVATTTNQQS